ncbi:MAG: hypothetical protein V2I57_16245 [Xanthomonadales bacterium]|jgi:hypothetical protein|nr:hypothetical protein [Xanthomonadales bacterium]
MRQRLTTSVLCAALVSGLLAACSESGPETVSNPTPASSAETGVSMDRPAPCGPGPNLLENPTFTLNEAGFLLPWKTAQHAGQASFETRYEAGVFTVERTGPEHWLTLTQTLQLDEQRGRRLELRVDLEMDTNGEGDMAKYDPGAGLVYRIWGRPFPNLTVTRQVVEDTFQHEPRLGKHDWTLVRKFIDVPENATRMQVGFSLRANGRLSVRYPELHDCGPAPVEAPGSE